MGSIGKSLIIPFYNVVLIQNNNVQDLRSYHDLIKNCDENDVIFYIICVPARLQSTKSTV